MSNRTISIIAITTLVLIFAGLAVIPSVDQAEALHGGDQISKKVKDKANKFVDKVKKKFGLGGGGDCSGCGE